MSDGYIVLVLETFKVHIALAIRIQKQVDSSLSKKQVLIIKLL